jgi:hypothetical protein
MTVALTTVSVTLMSCPTIISITQSFRHSCKRAGTPVPAYALSIRRPLFVSVCQSTFELRCAPLELQPIVVGSRGLSHVHEQDGTDCNSSHAYGSRYHRNLEEVNKLGQPAALGLDHLGVRLRDRQVARAGSQTVWLLVVKACGS